MSGTGTAPAPHHWRDLDGLRGALSLCIVLLHFGINRFLDREFGWPGFCFDLSVDVFFVMSGFVLTRSFRNRRPSIGQFIAGRIFRLWPVYLVTTALLLGLSAKPPGFWDVFQELFAAKPIGGRQPINFPAWSVTWEFFVPVVAVIVLGKSRIPAWIKAACAIFVVAAMAATSLGVAKGEDLFLIRSILGLALGNLLYGAFCSAARPRFNAATSYSLLAALFAIMAFAPQFPALALALPLIASGLVLSLATGTTRVLSSRGAQWLGAVSYTMYLAHIPVLQGLAWVFGTRLDANPGLKLGGIVLTLLLALLLTLTVEQPFMRLGKRLVGGDTRRPGNSPAERAVDGR